MNPKPLVALNHFTVPLAITSSPRDQKNNNEPPVPANRACPTGARYAVWSTLDSLNDIGICAEIVIICHFCLFRDRLRWRNDGNGGRFQFIEKGRHRRRRHGGGGVRAGSEFQ